VTAARPTRGPTGGQCVWICMCMRSHCWRPTAYGRGTISIAIRNPERFCYGHARSSAGGLPDLQQVAARPCIRGIAGLFGGILTRTQRHKLDERCARLPARCGRVPARSCGRMRQTVVAPKPRCTRARWLSRSWGTTSPTASCADRCARCRAASSGVPGVPGGPPGPLAYSSRLPCGPSAG
jgi:hypothetical protein